MTRATTWDQREVEGPGEEIVITCPEHGLNKTVDSLAYAVNLVNYHNREAHPDEDRISVGTILADPHCGTEPERGFDIAAAAAALVAAEAPHYSPDYKDGARAVWEALLGLPDAEAYYQALVLSKTTLTIHQPPF